MGILVREVERCLDTYLFLDDYPRWESGGPHCPYILQHMFAHVEPAEQKEFDCGIWWGHQQSMPEWDTSMETPTIDLVGYKATQEEIFMLYQEVYQLKRAPGTVPGDLREAEEVHQEILDSLKEHLWHGWSGIGPAQPEEPVWGSAGMSRPDPWSNFQWIM